ncbi:hypothetical protein HPB50_004015 [Hyalomma asiaticum]|uniref:Uncharacterized protein n=1 Tax=Hyalomma asiaticum TaxID=266040 RepID=A0ACB7RVF8_HYAAI|nr:hypothetical protein HPB50_004015 [Hyalomma asiaticum]
MLIRGVPQQLQPTTASVVTHHLEETITERWASSSATPVTNPAPQVDALAASTDPASPTPVPLAATTSYGPSEGIMERDDNEALGWDTVHYRSYTTRKLKGKLRSERVAASTTATGVGKVEERLERLEQAYAVSVGAWSKLQQQMEHFLQQKLDEMQEQITHWIEASQGARNQATIGSRPPEHPEEFIEPSLVKRSSLTAAEASSHPNTATQPCRTTQNAVLRNFSINESKSPAGLREN